MNIFDVNQACDWVWYDPRSTILINIHLVVVETVYILILILFSYFSFFDLLSRRGRRAFLNAKITSELEEYFGLRLLYPKMIKMRLIYLFPYKSWTSLRSKIDRPNATACKVNCSCYNLFVIRTMSVVDISKLFVIIIDWDVLSQTSAHDRLQSTR